MNLEMTIGNPPAEPSGGELGTVYTIEPRRSNPMAHHQPRQKTSPRLNHSLLSKSLQGFQIGLGKPKIITLAVHHQAQ